MTFEQILDQAIAMLQRRGRLTYRTLKRHFELDDDALADLKEELLHGQRLAVDEDARILVWIGEPPSALSPTSTPVMDRDSIPLSYTPPHLAERIFASRGALEGERKHVTVLFADIKDSTELIKNLDPEAAQQLLDPAIQLMMDAVHRFEGTVNQVLGDGIMALFGAPLAHEDHAARACYTALAMQAAMRGYTESVRRTHGMTLQIRVGLNSGEVVVRAIGNDLHMDYSAVGQTTHLAARMEQLASPGSIVLTASTLRLVEGLVRVVELGPVPVKGVSEPVEVFELTAASGARRRLQASVARGLTRFVGREAETEALRKALDRAGGGHGQVVAAVGEAGLGKSRLTYEFVRSPRTHGWLILEAACVSYGSITPFFPIVDLLKRYFRVDDGDDPRTVRAKVTGHILTLDERLQEAIPAVLFLLEALPPDSAFLTLEPAQRRRVTLDALRRILLRESQAQPLLLVLEDLHWADAETQALLDSLVSSLPTARLLLLVNYRPEYGHAWGSKTYYTQLRLDPLPPVSAGEFLRALLGDESALEPLKRLLVSRTEGNPFFLEESVRTLLESRLLVGQPGAYVLEKPISSIQVPPTVQAVLAARIDRLSAEQKRVVQTAAVIGTEVPVPLLQAVVDVPEDTLHRGLTHLQAAEFLYETRLFPEREYTFKHALTQQVAYHSLLGTRRQQIHGRIAHALTEHFTELAESRPELLAHHYAEAGLAERAVASWSRAGHRASERSAYVEAISHLRSGLEALRTLPENAARAEQELTLQLTLAASLQATHGYTAPEVLQAYSRAHTLCQQMENTPQQFSVLAGLRRFYTFRADVQAALQVAEQLLALAQRQENPALLREAHWALGQTMFFQGEFVSARAHLEQSIIRYTPQAFDSQVGREAAGTQVACLLVSSAVLNALGYPDQALIRLHEGLRLARELAHPFTLATALSSAAHHHRRRRELQTAHEMTEALMALACEQGFPMWIARATVLRGWIRAMQGQAEEGISLVDQVLNSQRHLIEETGHPTILEMAAQVYGAAGRAEEGLRWLAEAQAIVKKSGARYTEAEVYHQMGRLLLAHSSKNHAEAEVHLRRAVAIARSQQAKAAELRATTTLSRLWQQQGKQAEGRQLLTEIYDRFTEGFDIPDLKEARALLDTLR